MGRKALPMNAVSMQLIINESETGFAGTLTDFFQLCCDRYNGKFNPAKPIYPAILYNRIKKGELTTSVKSTRGTAMSAERREKFLQGRKNKKRRSRVNTDTRHETYLRKEFPEQTKLVEKILQGSMAAAIKLKCIDCCCGDRESIRLCTSYGCPLWNLRPFREKNHGVSLTVETPIAIVSEDAA